jgi:hypothetical protein
VGIAGPLGYDNGVVRAGSRAGTALLALAVVDFTAFASDRNGAEPAGGKTGFRHALAAVVGNADLLDRTAVAGRIDDMNDLAGIRFDLLTRHLAHRKTDTLTEYFTLLVYTATVPRTFQGNKIAGICLNIIFHNFPLKGLTADIHENIEFELP